MCIPLRRSAIRNENRLVGKVFSFENYNAVGRQLIILLVTVKVISECFPGLKHKVLFEILTSKLCNKALE